MPVDPAQAIASGGDTLLGRMLARATNADTAATASKPDTAVRNVLAATSTTTTPATSGTASSSAVDAFLNAFSAALAKNDAPQAASSVAEQTKDNAAPLLVDASTTVPTTSPVMPFAIPVATADASPIAPPAPASTLPQAQPVDPQAVIDQIVRGMSINTGDGQSTVKLRLVPENLGDVSVKLTVSGGTVSATITTHSADAQNAIVAGQPQLAKTLADAGLKLQSFNVGLAGNGLGGNSDQRQQQAGSRSTSTRRVAGVADESGTDETDLLAAPSFGPPIYTASRGLGALNYLV